MARGNSSTAEWLCVVVSSQTGCRLRRCKGTVVCAVCVLILVLNFNCAALLQVPPVIAEAVVQSSSRHGSTPTSPRSFTRPASQSVASELGSSMGAPMAPMANGGSAAGSLGSEGFITPVGGSPVAPSRSPVGRVESSPARLGALPPGSPLGKLPLPPGQGAAGEEGGSQAGDGEAPGNGTAAATAAGQPGLALPAGLPPLLSPDFAVNAFLTRVLFDLLRRPDFQVGAIGLLECVPDQRNPVCYAVYACRQCPMADARALADHAVPEWYWVSSLLLLSPAGARAGAHPAAAVAPAAPRLHPDPGGGWNHRAGWSR